MGLELNGRQVTKRRVDALVHVNLVQKVAELGIDVSIAQVMRQVNFLLFESAHQAFGIAVLSGLPDFSHTDGDVGLGERGNIGCGCVLDSLVGVVDTRWLTLRQGTLQGGQGQRLVECPPQVPAPNRTAEDIHDHRQVDEFLVQPYVGDIGHPDLIRGSDGYLCHSIRVAWEGMVAIGGATAPALELEP